ncbi:PEP/pyruvate-binding domain-containing protein [Gudongella sp. DL1XJH-153]|uniref:PEP/pyruvate-binding domain-containing protein n=1 Tax=Gudongella sp. DL1XJH-153 TaxID=3409804 RepID=UPI003BB7F745
MAKKYVHSLSKRRLNPYVGSKAESINFLLRQGINVPNSWIIPWTAYEDNLLDSHTIQTSIRNELDAIIDPNRRYAVRSSASVEDSQEFSCAGLFNSYLQVQGIDNVTNCIIDVWSSLESPEFEAYWKHNMSSELNPKMAVIIQEMVQPLLSGVVFTKNPISGFSETIIEAGPGTGESQAESHQNPERWVSKWGNWSQKPENGLLSELLAREIVSLSSYISKLYGRPADLEWAWDGEELYFLQVRPITRLNIPVYSNRISREMLPGIIKPLVWSVNTSLINPVWADILTRLTGERSWNPDSFTGHYYYRAYFNMSIFGKAFERLGMPAEALELLYGLEQDGPEKPKMQPGIGIIHRLPGLISFSMSLVGINNRLDRLVKVKKPAYDKLAISMEYELDSKECLQLALQISDETREVAYYNIMVPMLAMMHHRLFSRILGKHGCDVRLMELRGAREAAALYNPQHTLQALHKTYFTSLT